MRSVVSRKELIDASDVSTCLELLELFFDISSDSLPEDDDASESVTSISISSYSLELEPVADLSSSWSCVISSALSVALVITCAVDSITLFIEFEFDLDDAVGLLSDLSELVGVGILSSASSCC